MSDLVWAVVRLVIALPLVVLLAVATVRWGLRARYGVTGGRRIRVIEQVPVGRSTSLALVAVGQRYYLLACQERHVSVVATFDTLPEVLPWTEPVPFDSALARLQTWWRKARRGHEG